MFEFRKSGLCAAGMILSLLFANAAFADEAKCHLTVEEKAANSKLSFDEFDQKGITPSTWRKLENAGCHAQAVEAAEDYLVNGPPQTDGIKSDILFHIAQSTAMAGDNNRAALIVAAARPADHSSHGDLDWPAYLTGTWAFLTKNKSLLDASLTKMADEPVNSNKVDADVLRGLQKCFDKSYVVAYDDCRPK